MRYRAIFISDLHLGTPGCQAKELLAVARDHARLRALDFSWARASELFTSHLVPARRQPTCASLGEPIGAVTKPSSSG